MTVNAAPRARFFIDILNAQGAIAANATPYTSLQPVVTSLATNQNVGHEWFLVGVGAWSFVANPNNNPFSAGTMFNIQQSKSLTTGQKGTLAPQNVAYPYMNLLLPNDTPQTGMRVSVNTSVQNRAPYGYYWTGQAEVTYNYQSGAQPLHAQNNGDPYAIPSNHAVVNIGGRYYDPSYGKTYTSLDVIDDQIIAGFAETGTDANGNPALFIRKNPAGRDIYEIVSRYGPGKSPY